jgi:hypothetical protein
MSATVPPGASEQDARAATEQAAQASNRSHTPALLAAITGPVSPARPAAETAAAGAGLSTWEWEGGQLHDHEATPPRPRPAAPARPSSPLLPAAGPR